MNGKLATFVMQAWMVEWVNTGMVYWYEGRLIGLVRVELGARSR